MFDAYKDVNPRIGTFPSLIVTLLNLSEEKESIAAETPLFGQDPFADIPEAVQAEWRLGPGEYHNQLSDSEKPYIERALTSQRAGFELSTLRGKVIWTSIVGSVDNTYYN